MIRKLFFIVLLASLLVQVFIIPAAALEVNDVAGEFICNCGCNKMLNACEMSCGKQLRGFIKEQIRKGLGKQQIMQYMKVNFKEAILAAPEKKGFSLTAWLTPFAVILIGGIVMFQVMNAWIKSRPDDPDKPKPGGKPTKTKKDKKYNDQVEKELEEFGW